jgi:hypothetical protein
LAVLGLALIALSLFAWLAFLGDLTRRPGTLVAVHGLLVLVMLATWRTLRHGGAGALKVALGAALAFRIVMALGPPALSDDVYRYVWDGRVQIRGIHPYRYAPDDAALVDLRDAVWEHVNHRELHTIYPPLSEALFLALAGIGAGVRGFKLAAGLLDFGAVLALSLLLRVLRLPQDRMVLYAWNPLAVIETAGSGHHEPAGIALVILAAAWTISGRPAASALALAGGVHAKLLPAVLVPSYVRRWPWAATAAFCGAVILIALPYALTGPALGAGTWDYADRWQRNAFLFAGILGAYEWLDPASWLKDGIAAVQQWAPAALPWDWLYRHVWPPYLARATAAAMAVAWIATLSFRRTLDAARGTLLAFGGVLLLAPTLHPWYVLWVLPFAAAVLSRGWLLLAALVPLAYLGGAGEVPVWVRCVEFVPALALMAWDGTRSWMKLRGSMRP